MIREKIVPVLWLLLAAVMVGASIGLAVRASAQPYDPTDIITPPSPGSSPCVLLAGKKWLCPPGFVPPPFVGVGSGLGR
jgi:hypothetical protein